MSFMLAVMAPSPAKLVWSPVGIVMPAMAASPGPPLALRMICTLDVYKRQVAGWA